MTKNSAKNNKNKSNQLTNSSQNMKGNPLSLEQSMHEVQATDFEKSSF